MHSQHLALKQYFSHPRLLIYWFEALPTGTWDNKKLESIDNKSLGPINISDQSRVDVRVCWVFAFSILSKKNAWATTILPVSKCLSIYPKHVLMCNVLVESNLGHCMFELFSEHTFCWLFDIKHSVRGMLNSLDIPTFWYPWDFCFWSMYMLKYPHPDSNK
jgi:hypothetical protein